MAISADAKNAFIAVNIAIKINWVSIPPGSNLNYSYFPPKT
ncbi:hypothetical protein H477_1840 [[Clostridium] sordellii ATCC 9714]|nr:hypothetical protein H477_1840 [[Clostridium] sordellii ATCC 9714] [Paeniclostridium sordellii ATCC 9714]